MSVNLTPQKSAIPRASVRKTDTFGNKKLDVWRKTMNCQSCRFWSEMVARSIGCGPVEALCLADGGPCSGQYTTGRSGCAGWKHDELGKIDDPPNYGEWNQAAYIEAEGAGALRAAGAA